MSTIEEVVKGLRVPAWAFVIILASLLLVLTISFFTGCGLSWSPLRFEGGRCSEDKSALSIGKVDPIESKLVTDNKGRQAETDGFLVVDMKGTATYWTSIEIEDEKDDKEDVWLAIATGQALEKVQGDSMTVPIAKGTRWRLHGNSSHFELIEVRWYPLQYQ